MKYLCLAYGDQKKMEKLTKEQFGELLERCKVYDAELRATGQLVQSASLEWDYVALRPTGKQPIVTDGRSPRPRRPSAGSSSSKRAI